MRHAMVICGAVAGVVLLYGLVGNILFRVFERRGFERLTNSQTDDATAFGIIKSIAWPVTFVMMFTRFMWMLPRRIVLAVEARWRNRAAVKAETQGGKAFRSPSAPDSEARP